MTMNVFDDKFLFEKIKGRGTGGYELIDEIDVVPFEFDKYIVDVILSSSDKFIGIKNIKIKKDFLSHEQKMHSIGYYDDSNFYQK